MDFDNKLYNQWKTKSTSNRRLFTDSPRKMLLESEKIFSSTAFEDQTETETFSLRFSESYINETQETSDLKLKEKFQSEVIVISDTDDESVNSYDMSKKLTYKKNNVNGTHFMKTIDESPKISKQKMTDKEDLESKALKKIDRKKIIIEESDSETEENEMPKILKETVAESIILSEKKKKDIMKWLETNFNGSQTSSGQDSIIADSRKSGLSSGNSSLERLEMNFETPNNRGKLLKSNTAEKSNKKGQKNSIKQSTIDQYFTKAKKGQLDIIKDRTPGSKCSDKTPVNSVKKNSRKVIIPESESFDSKTPKSVDSDRTPINIPKKYPLGNKNSMNPKTVIPETQSSTSEESRISNHQGSHKNLLNGKEKFEKAVIIPETQTTNNSDSSFEQLFGTYHKQTVIIPESLEITDDLETIDSSVNRMSSHETENDNQAPVKNAANNTIDECADILENLYGITWKNKASTIISATEPKNRTMKIIKDTPAEKKVALRNPLIFSSESDSDSSNIKNSVNTKKSQSQTTSKKSRIKKKLQDDFINDDSTTESSPDCSYYTALTNPTPSQNNPIKNGTTSTVKASDKMKKVLSICDSESDCDKKWNKVNKKKLSYDSSTTSSETSEYDPEDVIPPKTVTKSLKLKRNVNYETVKYQLVQEPNKSKAKKSFLASLSKDVPMEEADFKAMTYRVKFNTLKEELCTYLYQLFNEKVFDNQLPSDMPIEWSIRLRGTAGKCYNKQSLKALGKTVRSSRIVLATKILDSPDRLRDTLIHEMCHAATWMINNVSDGHGSFWKAWANKAMKTFPELPPISRCHNYEIQTKYTYKCTSCGYSIGRHSKSLDLNRKRCGYCYGKFELLINKVTKNGTVQKKSTAQTKEPSGFALYVKENYQSVKQSGIAVKHGEVMKILGKQFSTIKLTPKPADGIRNNGDESP